MRDEGGAEGGVGARLAGEAGAAGAGKQAVEVAAEQRGVRLVAADAGRLAHGAIEEFDRVHTPGQVFDPLDRDEDAAGRPHHCQLDVAQAALAVEELEALQLDVADEDFGVGHAQLVPDDELMIGPVGGGGEQTAQLRALRQRHAAPPVHHWGVNGVGVKTADILVAPPFGERGVQTPWCVPGLRAFTRPARQTEQGAVE